MIYILGSFFTFLILHFIILSLFFSKHVIMTSSLCIFKYFCSIIIVLYFCSIIMAIKVILLLLGCIPTYNDSAARAAKRPKDWPKSMMRRKVLFCMCCHLVCTRSAHCLHPVCCLCARCLPYVCIVYV